MNLRRTIIHAYLYGPYLIHKVLGIGPFGRRQATTIQPPIQTDGNALKAALFRHFVKQYHEASCSVATIVSVVNAIRAIQLDNPVVISQMDILDKVKTGNWKARMSEKGYNGRRGIPLPLLGEIVASSLNAYGVEYKSIETVQTRNPLVQPEIIRADLKNRLQDFETKGNGLIIAHFDQGAFIQVLNIPHISPVGGFDIQSGDVIILDVDPEQHRPYKVAFDTFCKGLFSCYSPVLRPFGYRSGGYVYIKLH